jgi:predicted HTH transcriptional regulator
VNCRATDLLELLKRPEGKTLEFKRDVSSPEGIARTVIAFANTAGGTILIGVEDGTRRVHGVRIHSQPRSGSRTCSAAQYCPALFQTLSS